MHPVFDRHLNVTSDTRKINEIGWTLLGEFKAGNVLKLILTVSQGECFQSMMKV